MSLFLVLVSVFILGGCGTAKPAENLKENIAERVGTIKTKVGNEYLLVTSDGIVNITSNKVNLDNYLKKPIRVSGMFSGSTLYVDKIESAATN